jgi:hypothetical protein
MATTQPGLGAMRRTPDAQSQLGARNTPARWQLL